MSLPVIALTLPYDCKLMVAIDGDFAIREILEACTLA